MPDDTHIGEGSGRFPATRWSAVVAARSDDPTERERAFGAIIAAYWKPVYKYIRIRWNKSNEDAKDLTQEFFARVIEKGFLDRYDPSKARLRTYLRVCVDGMVANEAKAASRQKRGGDTVVLSLDFTTAESELVRSRTLRKWSEGLIEPGAGTRGVNPVDEFFEREWIRSLFGMAVEALRLECESRGKETHFRLFQLYDLDEVEMAFEGMGPEEGTEPEKRWSYESLAKRFELSVTDVTNYLSYVRREFRRITLEKLRDMTSTDEEFRREARSLLGVDVP